MITLNKTSKNEIIINTNTNEIKTLFIENKIWLNKKEISKLY
jgi:hypothetical protein